MTARRLALTVIGGFLGAGKTTLLNRWLQALPAGQRVAVLVNDFGAINIDSALVASRAGDAVALTNGCVCCSIGDDFSAALLRVLDAEPPFEAVVIEASGVSDPWRIAQLGLAAPELALHAVVVLVDAGAVLAQAADPLLADTLQRQLAAADLVVLNKVDCADQRQLAAVRQWIAGTVPGTPVLETVDAAVPAALLGDAEVARPGQAQQARGGMADDCAQHHAHGHGHPHAHADLFEAWSLQPAGVLCADALRRALDTMPAGVLRFKGIVRTDRHGWAEVQFAGRHGSLRRADAPRDGAALVAIGLRGQLPHRELDRLVAVAATS